MQPPVGYRFPLSSVVRALAPRATAHTARLALEREVAQYFGVQRAFAVTSGKAALTTTLRVLHGLTGRTKVIVPAYTCYSVPSAIIKAGLIPVPCDIRRGSFDYDYDELRAALGPDVLCALSIHPFGIPSDTARLKHLCRPAGIFVVEDAAQAMSVSVDGQWLGTRGDVGFFSLGRGKNVTCGSGGIIVTSVPDIAEAMASSVEQLAAGSLLGDARTLLALSALSIFISPGLYWLPVGIPSLKLGETIFHDDFPIGRLSDFQARLFEGWTEALAALNAVRREAGEFYLRQITGALSYGSLPYLRFPVMVENRAVRDRVLREGRPLGISAMYPASIGAIPQIAGLLTRHRFPEAERTAAVLLTLPTHPLLTARDRAAISDIVNAVVRGAAA